MKKLLIFHVGGDLERILHEVAHDGIHQVAGIIGAEASSASVPHFRDLAALAEADRTGCVFFISGDARLLNQHRLASYMEIKRRGWPIVSLKSPAASMAPGIKLRENAYIDRGTRVLSGASIGANSWVMQGSELGANSKIGSSCWVGSYCRVSERATLEKNCTLGDGVIIGPDVVLPAWSTIKSHSRIMQSPATTLFTDSRFKSPAFLFDSAQRTIQLTD
jgi:UDP-3-O-[3-hydroxymyristoyl] glucosamine N-acyltransferase